MKLWKYMLFAALLLVAVLSLASCGCDHVYGEMLTRRPTCNAEGEWTFTCLECGDVYTKSEPRADHSYTKTVHEAACTEPYTEITICRFCGESKTVTEGYPHGHLPMREMTATGCVAYCEYCSEKCTKFDEIHDYKNVVVPIDANGKATMPYALGMQKKVCRDCGATALTDNAVLVDLTFDQILGTHETAAMCFFTENTPVYTAIDNYLVVAEIAE